jgi:ribonucleoside-diphosphate reductase beta chain
MPSLLELTQQGDVGTVADESQLDKDTKLMSPQHLYELWERQHWGAYAIDLERDRADWATITGAQRDEILWGLSSFFVGEERVTTQFSGLVMAYEDEHEESFLATQQVDEARHMQFFDRYYREVFEFGESGIGERLDRVREHVTDSFNVLFDEALVEAGNRLIADAGDQAAKVEFITTYHLVIEGILALTGQFFITDWFERNELMPGFVEGFQKIARDEHRHVAYGTWYLQRQAREPELADRIQSTLTELLPVAAGVLVPPGKSLGDEYTFMGYTSEEQNEFAFRSLTRRLKVIGLGLPAAA